ncbi:MAG: hypothetical protein EB036_11610 [Betaproteobacteria bacterium]|nr:hypothetical protein [Betaproteobacteria bacterium]
MFWIQVAEGPQPGCACVVNLLQLFRDCHWVASLIPRGGPVGGQLYKRAGTTVPLSTILIDRRRPGAYLSIIKSRTIA